MWLRGVACELLCSSLGPRARAICQGLCARAAAPLGAAGSVRVALAIGSSCDIELGFGPRARAMCQGLRARVVAPAGAADSGRVALALGSSCDLEISSTTS